MVTTGQLIRAARSAMGISQARLASGLQIPGVSNGTISLWERDRKAPSLEEMGALARELNFSVEDLTGDGNPGSLQDSKPSVGRPRKPMSEQKHNYRSLLTLDGPIPEWIGYEDLKVLVRQYRGRFYDERNFRVWVEVGHPIFGQCASKIYVLDGGPDSVGVRRRVYRWADVRAWIVSTVYNPTETPTPIGGSDAPR